LSDNLIQLYRFRRNDIATLVVFISKKLKLRLPVVSMFALDKYLLKC